MTQISWRAWTDDAFAEAKAANKPVLLSLTAVWCQWCRTMDEQTYGNEAIAQYINDNLIPIRVDSDKRPDVNARYTHGGWPTTCVLAPEGDLIWGGTFVAPNDMAQLLPQVLNEFKNNPQGLAQHVAQQREQLQAQTTAPPLDASLNVGFEVAKIAITGAKQNFDFAFGGFGREQKFPHVEALELCMEQYSRAVTTGDEAEAADCKIMIDKTLTGLANGEMCDVDGGFFRYTQTPDWREPHFEKLLDDNALLARTFTRAYQLLGDERWKTAAEKTFGYLDGTLYNASQGTWGGSQAADNEYYAQPLAERSEWNPPTVDGTVLCGPNALAVRAYVSWWQATGDVSYLAKAKRGMDFIVANLLKPDGALDHFFTTDEDAIEEAGRVPTGMLSDAADVTAACLDLYEAGQGVDYLINAEDIANWVRGHLEDPRGSALFDAVNRPDAIGNLKFGTKDVPDNMQMADALLRLFLATGEEEHARLAQRIMQAFLPAIGQLGFFGSGFALAAERAVLSPVLVHIIGSAGDPQTDALIAAAQKPYRYERFVQPLDPSDPDDAEHIENLEYGKPTTATAYVSVATKRMDPITDPAALTEAVVTAA